MLSIPIRFEGDLMVETKKVAKILNEGSKEEKIKMIESLSDTDEPEIINKIIEKLDDEDIEVRGEAFSSLVLNVHDISKLLVEALRSESKNIRGFSTLVLANRRSSEVIPDIIPLTDDPSSMVRGCAVGALGYLKAQQAKPAIHKCFHDPNLEVKKSALKAAIDIGERLPEEELKKFQSENDPELEKLLIKAKKN